MKPLISPYEKFPVSNVTVVQVVPLSYITSPFLEVYNKPYHQLVLICLKMGVLVCLTTCWGCWTSEQLCLKIFFFWLETLCKQINQTLITTVFIHNLSPFMCLDDHFIHQPWYINQKTTILSVVDHVYISFGLLVVSESFTWFFVGPIKSISSSNSFLYFIKARISLSRTFMPGSLG